MNWAISSAREPLYSAATICCARHCASSARSAAGLTGLLSTTIPSSRAASRTLNKQIAYELGVSEATIKAHVSAILQKLGVESRTQAVIAAAKIAGGEWKQADPAK